MNRRTFLRTAAVSVALPLLPSLQRESAAAAPRQKRLLCYFVPNGIHMPDWTPPPGDLQLSPLLAPLQPFQSSLVVISGLHNLVAKTSESGDHARGTAAFLTGQRVRRSAGADISCGVSMDQVAVQALRPLTRFPSLQLGLEGDNGATGCDFGYSCAYVRSISWAGPKQPLNKLVTPQSVFDLLFGGPDARRTQEELARRRRLRKSVLDAVRGDAQRLSGGLARGDRQKLDEYLTGVRELERRLQVMPTQCTAPERPDQMQALPEQVRLMTDLLVLALQCDQTRIATFMLGNGQSNRYFPFLGITRTHHEVSHHENQDERIEAIKKINQWEVEQLAYLLTRLQQVQDGEHTLLDNCAVLFSSEIADGNSHQHSDLPVLLAGGLGGELRGGRHLALEAPAPMANLHISLLRMLGVSIDRFGEDGTGPLAGLA